MQTINASVPRSNRDPKTGWLASIHATGHTMKSVTVNSTAMPLLSGRAAMSNTMRRHTKSAATIASILTTTRLAPRAFNFGSQCL